MNEKPTVGPRKRGRPRKHPVTPVGVRRGRGRPKKVTGVTDAVLAAQAKLSPQDRLALKRREYPMTWEQADAIYEKFATAKTLRFDPDTKQTRVVTAVASEKTGSNKTRRRWFKQYFRDASGQSLHLVDITASVIRKAARDLANGWPDHTRLRQPSTVLRDLTYARIILKMAAAGAQDENDPTWWGAPPTVCKFPREKKDLQVVKKKFRKLNDEEFDRLLKELPPVYRDIARFSLATGLRPSNACQLRWSQLDMRGHQWRLNIEGHNTKAKEPIWVPINSEAKAIVMERRKIPSKIYVFVHYYPPGPHSRGSIRKITRWGHHTFRAARERAGLPWVTPYTLRRTFASRLAIAGKSTKHIMRLGGWATESVMLGYVELDEDDLIDACEALVRKPVRTEA